MKKILVMDITGPASPTASGAIKSRLLNDKDDITYFVCYPVADSTFRIYSKKLVYQHNLVSIPLRYQDLKAYCINLKIELVIIRLSLRNIEYLAYAKDLTITIKNYIFWVFDDEFTYTMNYQPFLWKIVRQEFAIWLKRSKGYWAISDKLAGKLKNHLGGDYVVVHNTFTDEFCAQALGRERSTTRQRLASLFFSGSISELINFQSLYDLLSTIKIEIPTLSITITSGAGASLKSTEAKSLEKLGVTITENSNYPDYQARISNSDFHIICYNFTQECRDFYSLSVPNKLPELIETRRPILYYGPKDFVAATLVREYALGVCIHSLREIPLALEEVRRKISASISSLPDRYQNKEMQKLMHASIISAISTAKQDDSKDRALYAVAGVGLNENKLIEDILSYSKHSFDRGIDRRSTDKTKGIDLASNKLRVINASDILGDDISALRIFPEGHSQILRIVECAPWCKTRLGIFEHLLKTAEELGWTIIFILTRVIGAAYYTTVLSPVRSLGQVRIGSCESCEIVVCTNVPEHEIISTMAVNNMSQLLNRQHLDLAFLNIRAARSLSEIVDFGSGKKNLLYGASNLGERVYRLLDSRSIRVTGFIDTYKVGFFCGLPLFTPERIYQLLLEDNFFIITTQHVYEVVSRLINLGIANIPNRILVVDISLFAVEA